MEENRINEVMDTTISKIRELADANTIMGSPIYTPDGITLVPISRISLGFGGGGIELNQKNSSGNRPFGGGNATGVKIDPIGFLVIKDGTIRMINVTPPASTTVDRLIDMVPQVMDRVDEFIARQKED